MARGQTCPPASSGPPQNGHGGRPAATTAWARRDERPGGGAGEPDAQQRRAVVVVVVDQRRVVVVAPRRLGQRLGLDDDPLVVGVPGQRHRADPELLLDRRVQRGRVGCLGRRHGGYVGLAGRPAYDLVEQRLDPLGEHRHLLLLQRDARRPAAAAGLQEEGALPGLADGARHEPLGRVVLEDDASHASRPYAVAAGAAPPRTASEAAAPFRRLRRAPLRGTRKPRSLPRSLLRIDERSQRRVGDDAHRRRVDHQPLELVEVHAEGVGEHRLDDVAVRDDDVDGVVAEPGVPVAHGVDRAGLHVAHRLAALARERHRRRVRLDDLPERVLGELLQLAAGPVAVAHLAQPVVDVPLHRVVPGEHQVGGLQAALQRAGDHGGQRYAGQPGGQRASPGCGRCRPGRRPRSSRRARRRRWPSCGRGGRAGRWSRPTNSTWGTMGR